MRDFTNNASALLNGGITAIATSIVVDDASKFPTPTGGSYFYATLIGLNANGQETSWEIVKCTARASNTLTVVRAQEGTSASSWPTLTRIELRITAGFANDLDDHVDNISNPHAVTAAQVGLGNVNNTSDANKPVSTATQNALDLKANLSSPTFTGTPLAPTAVADTNTTQIATTAFVVGQGYLKSSTAASTYEPAISHSTGYAKWTGAAWSFVNETYSLSTHNHTGVYEPVITTLANTKGGTGQDSSGWSGLVKATAGTWSTASAGTDYASPSQTFYIGTTQVAINRGSGALSLAGVNIDGSAGSATSATKATNLVGGNTTTLLGSMPYQSGTDTTTQLAPNTSATKNFLSMTGTGTNGAAPAWSAVSKSDVGLSAVENTALSTWAGTSNITTVGSVTTGNITNLTGGNNTTLLGAIPYQSNTNTTTLLGPNTTATKKFLRMTGSGVNGAAPAWDTVAASDVGLGSVENTALSTWAGSTNITTVGTIATGNIGNLTGGNTTTLLGSMPYQSAVNTTTMLGPNTSSTKKFLRMTGTGTNGAVPAWDTVTASDVGLGSVENTALSTWVGSTNITTVGTIGSGTWNGTAIADGKIASTLTGKTYNSLTLTAAATGFTIAGGTSSKTLTVNNTIGLSGTDSSTLNIGTGGTLGTAAFTATTAYEASGAVSTHAALQNVHGLAITAAKTLTVQNSLTLAGTDSSTLNIGTGGTLGTAAYTASSSYAAVGQTMYIGTTAVAINRASANLALTGITSIDGNAAGLSATLAVGSGGTGQTTLPAALTALHGFTTTVSSASTITLTNTSTSQQIITGSTAQTIVLPVTSTLALGWRFVITNNNSSNNLTVNSSGGNLVMTVLPGTEAEFVCILTSGTTAASWDADIVGFTTLPVTHGGTGVATLTGIVKANGTAAFAAATANTDYLIPALANTAVTGFKTATFNSQATLSTTTGAVTIDWTAAQNYKQNEPTGTITYTFTAPPGPCHLQLIVDSDGTSTAQTINWPGTVTWYGATWAGANNKKAVINFWYDGTNYHAMGTNQV